MLAWTSRLAAGAATTTVVVVGNDTVVGKALELLLRGSGYDARFEALRAFDVGRAFRGTGLLLLAPGLSRRERKMVLSTAEALSLNGGPAILELISAAVPQVGSNHALVPWPCRPEDLENEIEDALQNRMANRTRLQAPGWPREREDCP